MILQGKRRLPTRFLPVVGKALKLRAPEIRYLEALIEYERARTTEDKRMREARLKQLHPTRDFVSMDMESFRLICDPIHYTILEMTGLKGFQNDPEWIQRRLGHSYTLSQVRDAMRRLFDLGLLEKTPDGHVQKCAARLTTSQDVPNEALKLFHKQLISKAITAIDAQVSSEREISASTLTIDSTKIPEAKQMIREFKRTLCAFLEARDGCGTDTYQLNVQLFRLTEKQDATPLKPGENQ